MAHVINFKEIEVNDKGSYIEEPMRIVDRREQVIRSKAIPLVKVLCQHHGIKKATWESEEAMKCKYPYLVQGLGTF